ncbi:hypothetical protein [Streptomyces sp. NPDC058701]|uniref:hypothetical protein n=1 Tax=Streptomyces sp. NPDC058701 TaxID=3346608 RepID=UPI00365655B3
MHDPLSLGEVGRASFVVGQVLSLAVEVLLPADRLEGGRLVGFMPARGAFEPRRRSIHHGCASAGRGLTATAA